LAAPGGAPVVMSLARFVDSLTRSLPSSRKGTPQSVRVETKQQGAGALKKRFGRAVRFDDINRENLAKRLALRAAERCCRDDEVALREALEKAALILIDHHGAFDRTETTASMMDQNASDIETIRSDPKNVKILANLFAKLLTAFAASLPKEIDEASLGLTMEAIGVVRGARELIGQWAMILTERDGAAAEVMKPWHRAVRENMKGIRGVRLDIKVSSPSEMFPSSRRSKMPVYDMAHDAFRGTPLMELLSIHVPVPVPYYARLQQMNVTGPSGSGKTQLLQNLLLGDVYSGHGVFAIDVEGDFSQALICHAMTDPALAERLVYIDPADPTMRPEINILNLGRSGNSSELMAYVMSALGEGFTGRMGGFFEALSDVMSEIEGANLDTLIDFLADDNKAQIHVPRLSDENADWVINQLPSGTNAQTRDYVHGRLSRLRGKSKGELGRMFRGKTTRLDLASLLDAGKIVVVRINSDEVESGGLGPNASLACRFYIASLVMAGMQRKIDSKRLWLCHLDEVAEMASGGDDKFLVRGFIRLRKRGVALAIYYQNLGQLKGDLRGAVLGSSGIKVAAKVQPKDRKEFAEAMNCSGELFKQIKKKDRQWAEMVVYIDQIADDAAICRFPLGTLERMPRMRNEDYERLMDRQRVAWADVNGAQPDIDEEDDEVVIPMKLDRPAAVGESRFL